MRRLSLKTGKNKFLEENTMKKIFTISLVILLAISLLSACGGNGSNNGDQAGGNNNSANADNNGNNDGGEEKFEYGKDYIAQNLKGDYSISYKYTSGGESALTMAYAQTSEGYYYNYMGTEGLFIKNGDKYDTYQGTTESGFEKVDFMDPISEEDLKNDGTYSAVFSMLDGFMIKYNENTSDMKKDGTATVAGRDCDKYTYQIAGAGMAYKYSYYIDKATGVCLKWEYDMAAGGETGGMTFECTEFKTSDVSLPSYK